MADVIKVEGVYKTYGETEVLKGVDLSVKKGERVAIIGSSGSGKSTLIRCLNGLETIDSGKVIIDGKLVKSTSSVAGKVGMVFQEFNLFPHYSVLDNVMKPCIAIKKLNKKKAKDTAFSMLELVRLKEKAEEYPANLSGGQKQRLAIARTLAMDPEIILFDEPTSALDPELAYEVFETIKSLETKGLTMIMVTHQIDMVMNFATRVIFLDKGKIEVDCSPETLKNSNNERLKSFLSKITSV